MNLHNIGVKYTRQFLKWFCMSEKVVAIEIQNNFVRIVGLEKSQGKISQWFQDTTFISTQQENELTLLFILNDIIEKYPFIKNVAVVIVMPDFPVLYRNNNGQSGSQSSLFESSNNKTGSSFQVINDQADQGRLAPTIICKHQDLHPVLNALENIPLNIASLVKGAPEWLSAWLVSHAEFLEIECTLAERNDTQSILYQVVQGRCTGYEIFTSGENNLHAPERLKEESCQFVFDTTALAENNNNGNDSLTNDKAFMRAEGSALCRFFNRFSSFNLLPQDKIAQFETWQRLQNVKNIGIRAALAWMVLMAVLLVPFLITNSNLKNWEKSYRVFKGQIQKIEELKSKQKQLLDRQENLGRVFGKRSGFAAGLGALTQKMTNELWLDRISYNMKSLTSLQKKDNSNLLLEGFALNDESVITLAEQLQNDLGFSRVTVDLLQKIPRDKLPHTQGTSKSFLYHFQISTVVTW